MEEELIKYKRIITAGLEYYIQQYSRLLHDAKDDQNKNLCKLLITEYQALKSQVVPLYENKKLSTLKRFFRDISEVAIATLELNYQVYIEQETGYKIELFEKFYVRANRILKNRKIMTDIQYREVALMIDIFSGRDGSETVVRQLNEMMLAYDIKKMKN